MFDEFLAPKLIGNISSAFWNIVKQLYYPETPFSFAVLSSDVLGRIYEIFLSKRLDLDNGKLILVDKPENIDRDVVTTPTYIIQEILRHSVLPKIQNLDLQELCKLKFADIACGSGSFLLELFQLLCDTLVDYYILHNPSLLCKTGVNSYQLPFPMKVELLTNCFFGVDKDFNAVEATKFGLLLKILEGEDVNTLSSVKPILPDLSQNIIFGNSLLTSKSVPKKYITKVNPFDFDNLKFDVVVGNPPYMASEDMKNLTPIEHKIYPSVYFSAYKQYDKYFLFIEKALNLLNENGTLGFIVPSKFMKVRAAEKLRKLISSRHYLRELITFGANQIFGGKTTYTCLLFLSKELNTSFRYEEVNDVDKWKGKQIPCDDSIRASTSISSDTWSLYLDRFDPIFKKITKSGKTLENVVGKGNIFNGIQTSANKTYIFQPISETPTTYSFVKNKKVWQIEKALTKPYFQTPKNHQLGLSSYNTFVPNARVIFPYQTVNQKLDIIPLQVLKQKYPFGYAYIKAHQNELDRPKRDIKPVPLTSDEWHRYGRHQSLEACEKPLKLIVGVLSQGEKYAVDTNGTLVSSGGTAGYCVVSFSSKSPYSIFYVQAILTSKPLEWVTSLYGEIFRGGYIARGTKVLKQLPFRVIDFNNVKEKKLHDDISDLQQELISIGDKISKAGKNKRVLTPLQREFSAKKKQMEGYIKELFNLNESEYSQIPVISEIYAVD